MNTQVATKADLYEVKAEIHEVKTNIHRLETDIHRLEAKVNLVHWMVGFNLAFTLAMFWKVFIA